jgi:hypothetical protein
MFTLVCLIRLNNLIENAAAQRRIDSWRPTPAAALRGQILMQVSVIESAKDVVDLLDEETRWQSQAKSPSA